jgi:hypothetical protein
LDEPEAYSVSAAPNESVVRGKVLRVQPAPGGIGTVWDVDIQEAEGVGNLANLARSRVGECLPIYIHPDLNVEIREGDIIRARIFFEGDERGGVFFLKGEDVHRQS